MDQDTAADEDLLEYEESEIDGLTLRSPTECLFCPSAANTIEESLSHMASTHGFQIPDIEGLLDLETFVSYLSLVVRRYFACLHCGQMKHSVEAVQKHMLAKGHCMLDLQPGSEFAEFWESAEDGDVNGMEKESEVLSDSEMRLPSGAITSSKQSRVRPHLSRRPPSNRDGSNSLVTTQLGEESEPEHERVAPPQKTRALALRDQMGVIGLSDQQRRSLIAVREKFQRRELRHRYAEQWSTEKIVNRRKHIKVSLSPTVVSL